MWTGIEFHILGAATRKARAPKERLCRGTESNGFLTASCTTQLIISVIDKLSELIIRCHSERQYCFLLFVIYINELANILRVCSVAVKLFADDLKMYAECLVRWMYLYRKGPRIIVEWAALWQLQISNTVTKAYSSMIVDKQPSFSVDVTIVSFPFPCVIALKNENTVSFVKRTSTHRRKLFTNKTAFHDRRPFSVWQRHMSNLHYTQTLNLTTVTLSTTIFLSLKWIASSRLRTALHVLWLKLLNFLISRPSSDLCTGLRLTVAINISFSHSLTNLLQPANLTTYAILSLFSLHVELASRQLSP